MGIQNRSECEASKSLVEKHIAVLAYAIEHGRREGMATVTLSDSDAASILRDLKAMSDQIGRLRAAYVNLETD